MGIDEVQLERVLGVPVALFAIRGASAADRLMMLRYYFARQPGSVRAVVYGVDAHSFSDAGLSFNSYQNLFPFIGDPEILAYIKRLSGSRSEYVLRRWICATRYNEFTASLAVRGYLRNWANFKLGTANIDRLARQVRQGQFRRIGFDADNVAQFGQAAEFAAAHHATLFLAYIPTVDILNQAEPEKFQRSLDLFRGYAASNTNVIFLNYNEALQSRHELFWDPTHLNREGQKEVTARLAEDLKRFLNRPMTSEINPRNGRAN